jgi:ammonium transporter, Amt family
MISNANNAWVLLSAALVMFMTVPALGLFYGGLVKKKNVLSVMMQSFVCLLVVSLLWVFVGYSLAFSPGELIPGVLGDFRWTMLNGIGPADPSPYTVSDPNGPVSHLTFVIFQCMFAVITPAVISGAFAERMKFSSYLLFSILWLFVVYIPLAHMAWSANGLFAKQGLMDFAGGTVVEINSGFSALAGVLMLGNRKNLKPLPPHNLTYTLIGGAMLWFGWFGFNAGSGLAADGLAASAFLATNTAAAAAGLAWAGLDWLLHKKPTLLGAVTGAVAGLVVITPAAGYVSAGGAMLLGLLAGGICYWFVVTLKTKFGYDDSLDAFGVHGVAGVIGTLGCGLLAAPYITQPFGMNGGKGFGGLFYGDPTTFGVQLAATVTAMAVAFFGTLLVFFAVKALVGLRVSDKEEAMGLDITQHNEKAYTLIE